MNTEVEIMESRWDTTLELLEGERSEPDLEQLHLDEIDTDGGTQSRATLNQEVIASYAQKIQTGSKFPPVDVYYDGERYWLADGFHRVAAYKKLKIDFSWEEKITVKIHQGTRRDAVLHSVGANDNHGLQRSNADKQRAVLTLLQDAEWGGWSNCQIARACRVDEKTVRNLRKNIAVTSDIRSDASKSGGSIRTYKTKHGTIAQMQVESIGGTNNPANTLAEDDFALRDEDRELRLQEDDNAIVREPQVAVIPSDLGVLATVAPAHPLSGSTVAIAELPDRDGAIVKLPNGSREYILFKDLQLNSSLEVQKNRASFPDSENILPSIADRKINLVGNPVIDASFSLYQIVYEISIALITYVKCLPSDLLQEIASAIATELGSRSASNQPIENSETIDN